VGDAVPVPPLGGGGVRAGASPQEERVPDLAFPGALARKDGIFKALALGAPFVKANLHGARAHDPGIVGKTSPSGLEEKSLPKRSPNTARRRRKSSCATSG